MSKTSLWNIKSNLSLDARLQKRSICEKSSGCFQLLPKIRAWICCTVPVPFVIPSFIIEMTEWPFNGKNFPCKEWKALTQRCHTAEQLYWVLLRFLLNSWEMLLETEKSSNVTSEFMESLAVGVTRLEEFRPQRKRSCLSFMFIFIRYDIFLPSFSDCTVFLNYFKSYHSATALLFTVWCFICYIVNVV